MISQLITAFLDSMRPPRESPHALIEVATVVDHDKRTVKTTFRAVTHYIEVVDDDGEGNVTLKVLLGN